MPAAAGLTGTQQGSVKCLWATASMDFASSATLLSSDVTIAVTGARLGDPCVIGFVTPPVANVTYYAFVSAADVVTARFMNTSGGTLDPAAQVIVVGVIKLENTAL